MDPPDKFCIEHTTPQRYGTSSLRTCLQQPCAPTVNPINSQVNQMSHFLNLLFIYAISLVAIFCVNAVTYGIEHALYDVTGHTFHSLYIEAQLASIKGQKWCWNKVDEVLGSKSDNITYF